MSRVEPQENPRQRKLRQEERGRTTANRRADSPGRTPGKAEGEEADVEQALKRNSD